MTVEWSKDQLAALRPLPPCARCRLARCTTKPEGTKESPICMFCALKEFMDDPSWRRYRPWHVVEPAQAAMRNNTDATIADWLGITKAQAAGLRRRVEAQLSEPGEVAA